MIQVSVRENGIRMTGHAGRAGPDGIDRVCAAVSALTCALINGLRDLTEDEIWAETDSGMAAVKWGKLSAGGNLLVDNWFLGMIDINRDYNCIEFQ